MNSCGREPEKTSGRFEFVRCLPSWFTRLEYVFVFGLAILGASGLGATTVGFFKADFRGKGVAAGVATLLLR